MTPTPHTMHTSCNNRIKQEGFGAKCCHCFPHPDCKYYPNAQAQKSAETAKDEQK